MQKIIIIFLSLAVIFLAAGFYFKGGPEWTKKTYPDYYNQGVSAYLDGKFEEASALFNHVVVGSKDAGLKSLALYNLGTLVGGQVFDESLPAQSRFQIAQYAIAALKEAIALNPDNQKAKYNLEILRNKLPELFEEMQEEAGEKGEPQPEPGYSPGGGPRGR